MRANWKEMVGFFADQLQMDAENAEWLRNTQVAQLLAELPYLAGCRDADRLAYAHVGTLLLASRSPQVFGHRAGDSLESRLFTVSHYDGGDAEIVTRGLALLQLASLSDHVADRDHDEVVGKYNPLNSGHLDYEAERDRLASLVRSIPCPEMDAIFSVDEAIRLGWWCCSAPEEATQGEPAIRVTA
jgi:hypothetical protein